MQGFIIYIQPHRDEDLWVHVLTENEILRLYRFYGARHSIIALGHKIDFFIQTESFKGISKLREALHLGFTWEKEREKKILWQSFIKLLFKHLKDIQYIDSFYYHLLEETALRLQKQNPIRALCETYAKILHFEGRLNTLEYCFICNTPLNEYCVIIRSFLGICSECLHKSHNSSKYHTLFNRAKIAYFIQNHDIMMLDDREVKDVWHIILDGL